MTKPTKAQRERLKAYSEDYTADTLFERNFAREMEDLGLLTVVSNCVDGSRTYRLTDAGRKALEE